MEAWQGDRSCLHTRLIIMTGKMFRVDYRYIEQRDSVIGHGFYIDAKNLSDAIAIAQQKKKDTEVIDDVYMCPWYLQK